jgi:hypothetical protein
MTALETFKREDLATPGKRASISEPADETQGALLREALATDAGDEFRREDVELLIGCDDDQRFALFGNEKGIVIGNDNL